MCISLQKANVSSVKYQVCRLIRMLVHICKTLDSMPAEVCQAVTAAFASDFVITGTNMTSASFAMTGHGCEESAANAAEVLVYEADIPRGHTR